MLHNALLRLDSLGACIHSEYLFLSAYWSMGKGEEWFVSGETSHSCFGEHISFSQFFQSSCSCLFFSEN